MFTEQGSKRWTVKEKAFIIIYTDKCIMQQLDYRQTVAGELQAIGKQDVTLKRILDMLYIILKKNHVLGTHATSDLISQGTRVFNGVALPEDLSQAMDQQRLEWNIGPMDIGERHSVQVANVQAKPTKRTTGYSWSHVKKSRVEKVLPRSKSRQKDIVIVPQGHKKKTRAPKQQSTASRSSEGTQNGSDLRFGNDAKAQHSDRNLISRSQIGRSGKAHDNENIEDLRHELHLLRVNNQAIHELLRWLARDTIGSRHDMSSDRFSTLRSIYRTIADNPLQAYDRLMRDLVQANESRDKFQKMVQDLIGRRDFTGPPEVTPPEVGVIRKKWNSLRNPIREVLSICGAPIRQVSCAASGGVLCARLEDLVGSGLVAQYDLSEWIVSLKIHTFDSIVAQAALGIALCCLLFHGPEPMCPEESWRAAVKIYETVEVQGGIEAVQQLDRTTCRSWFQDEHFRTSIMPQRAKRVTACFEKCLSEVGDRMSLANSARLDSCMPADLIQRGLELKRLLMVSSNEYRIEYVLPGSPFDSTFMQAEDQDGRVLEPAGCFEKVVLICLFPALYQYSLPSLEQDASVPSVLAQNKRFFSIYGEKTTLSQGEVVAKAVVLVHGV